ncbi:MAG TPA: universal stress protein [Gemmatimonadales bacterium]|nr:universal stress protein [Gemmatimonadales bacterium]
MTSPTQIGHVMAATDESDAGRQAVIAALGVASRVGARATIARVLPFDGNVTRGELEQLQRWVESDLPRLEPRPATQYAISYGVPGVEISRMAERVRADLLVLGRKRRTQAMRLLLGDTADAVARRSRIPCLFVPDSGARFDRILVAVDGSPRGSAVLRFAIAFARELGAGLRVLTVERPRPGEPVELAVAVPAARGESIQAELNRGSRLQVEVRHGDVAEQILDAAREGGEDVVVIGCHRGGPAGVIEAGSTARRVIHQAPCAVVTVPL